MLAFSCYSQDSIRTKNDKPGTPQSLRTVDNTPQNKVHFNNTYKAPGQSINHGATESNKIINTNDHNIINDPNQDNNKLIPKTPITISNEPARQAIKADTSINKGTMSNGQSNATNPIRK